MLFEGSTSRIAQAREAGEFTDFAFSCAGKTLPVHRIIVCSQSSVLHEACAGKWDSPASRVYSMDAHPLHVVERMVEYFYTGDYSDGANQGANSKADDVNTPVYHAKMCVVAEKYGIQGLADLATAKYGKALQEIPDMRCFLASVARVYESKPQPSPCLRDWAVAFARDRLPAHLSDPKTKRAFDRCIARNREFAHDMLYSALRHPLIGVCFDCGPITPEDTYHCRCRDCPETGELVGERREMDV